MTAPVPSGVTSLYDACRQFLDACQEATELTSGGRIERAYVSPGPPAWDAFPQLTVHAGGPNEADTAPLLPPLQPMHRISAGLELRLVTLTATVLRCSVTVPENAAQLPTAESLDQAGRLVNEDVWAIWNHLATLKRAGRLFPPAKTREMILDPAMAVNPNGGAAGWQIPIRVQLDGFVTVAS